MITFIKAELRWYSKRMRCRLLNWHNDTCRGLRDHMRYDGTFIGKPW